jgi:hypothetical protein
VSAARPERPGHRKLERDHLREQGARLGLKITLPEIDAALATA